MESIRDRLRTILENNMSIEFKDHEHIKKMNLSEAKAVIIDPVIENTIDQIIDACKDFKK
jgi:hypothetical protein